MWTESRRELWHYRLERTFSLNPAFDLNLYIYDVFALCID